MKKFTLLHVFFLFIITGLHAQIVNVTFTAKFEGVRIQLDSVIVNNLTQGGTTTLYFPDTVLVLGPSSVQDNTEQNPVFVSQNFPNPFSESTRFDVFLRKEESVRISAYDVAGRRIAEFNSELSQGKHTFNFLPGKENFYFLTAETKTFRKTMKMICCGAQPGQCSIEYAGFSEHKFGQKAEKTFFPWSMGDNLRYTGFATIDSVTIGTQSIENDPISDFTFTFYIMRGLCCIEEPYVTDPDGNTYRTVKIGSQCWMSENLRTSKYDDFTEIPFVESTTTWAGLTGPGYYWFNSGDFLNDSMFYVETYGLLYNWYAVNPATNGNKNICPPGWHMPTHTEWLTLANHLGGNSVAGGKLKERGFIFWNNPNTGATNQTGFRATSAGLRNSTGDYTDNIGINGLWWSISEYNTENGLHSGISYNSAGFQISNMNKKSGTTVRCVKD